MKRLLKWLVNRVARSPSLWWIMERTLLRVSRALEWQRELFEDQKNKNLLAAQTQQFFPDLIVRHGPFKGLRYPWTMAVGSPLFSKILGSYERELAGITEALCHVSYPTILNVGSAEGYYAVGFGQRIPQASVIAYDINPEARTLVRQLADHNNIGKRLTVEGECNPEVLLRQCRGTKGLILSDCEGYEKNLFSRAVTQALTGWDVLIEVHDLIDIEVSTRLLEAFKDTHVLVRIQSVDDIQKALTYGYEELAHLSVAERRRLLSEGRRSIMEWFLFVGRESPGGASLVASAQAAAVRTLMVI